MRGAGRDTAEVFFQREFPRLVGGLTLHVGDRHVAEQLAQEAMLRAFRRWKQVSALESPGGWVWRVATNLATSHQRRQQAAARARIRLGPGSVVHEDPDGAHAVAVRHAVSALPERQRTALILRYYLDLPAEQAAQVMDVSSDAVRSLTKRAVAALREEFTEPGPSRLHREVGDG